MQMWIFHTYVLVATVSIAMNAFFPRFQVVNPYGPQTVTTLKDADPLQFSMNNAKKVKQEPDDDGSGPANGVQERTEGSKNSQTER